MRRRRVRDDSAGVHAIGRERGIDTSDRRQLARAILLGLEVLVAADIIATVAISPTLTSVGVLAGIVLVRTFLSFSLEVEIEGRWPWRRQGAASPEQE